MPPKAATAKGPKPKKRYEPGLQTAPFALLISLYRAREDGVDVLGKEDLTDRAEASGLAPKGIRPVGGLNGPATFGQVNPQSFYSGWSSMKKLVDEHLVIRWSNPAKFAISPHGEATAVRCMVKAGLRNPGPAVPLPPNEAVPAALLAKAARALETDPDDPSSSAPPPPPKAPAPKKTAAARAPPADKKRPREPEVQGATGRPSEPEVSDADLAHVMQEGPYSAEEAVVALRYALRSHAGKPPVPIALMLLRGEVPPTSAPAPAPAPPPAAPQRPPVPIPPPASARASAPPEERWREAEWRSQEAAPSQRSQPAASQASLSRTRGCTAAPPLAAWRMPPLASGQSFKSRYSVVLVLDNRESFSRIAGKRSLDQISKTLEERYSITVYQRSLPVGDAVWLAVDKATQEEFILDVVVERKRTDDLWHSIKEKRYRDQKHRLQECGLLKKIYLIQGDPNKMDNAEALKTAAITTEIEGFDVQRVEQHDNDVVKFYNELTKAITDRYEEECRSSDPSDQEGLLTYEAWGHFLKNKDVQTVRSVFALQLMQVKMVTVAVVEAIQEHYPTIMALVDAYAALGGDRAKQEALLSDISYSNKKLGLPLSKRIFELVWAE